MKRSIFILASALAIFIFTLFITNNNLVNETVTEADNINEMQVQNIKSHLDNKLKMNELAVHSFLSANFYYRSAQQDTCPEHSRRVCQSKNSEDSNLNFQFSIFNFQFVSIREQEIPRFKEYVYESLRDFVKLNPYIQSATFLIDPSVYPEEGPEGFAPMINCGDSICHDLAETYDFIHSEAYKHVTTTGQCQWRLPSKHSRMHGKSIIYYVPIYRQTGGTFGVFALNVSIDMLRNGLTEFLPYGKDGSFIIVADNQDNIILSTNQQHERFSNISNFKAFLANNTDFDILNTQEDSLHHDVVNCEGDDYFVYNRALKQAPWKTITVCLKSAIYADLSETRNSILIVSAIGMLLMLLCCIVVFRIEKKNLKRKATIEEELKLAAKVQQSILKPTSYTLKACNGRALRESAPSLRGRAGGEAFQFDSFMRPARETGGDLYDYVEKDGKLIFCIGDVSGKGMPAALFMTQVISLFRNSCIFSSKPEVITSQINNVLAANNPDMTFCTLFVGVLSPIATGEDQGATLTYCNAGHNPPVIIPALRQSSAQALRQGSAQVHQNEGATFLTVKPNVAVGMIENYPYQAETLTLPFLPEGEGQGWALLLYTDGITEARNAAHQLFGEERLLKYAASPDTLVAAVDDFVAGYEQSDDITAVMVRILGE